MEREYPVGIGVVKWVSTAWLEEHLDSRGLTILDCQPNIHDYILEHIPGAIYINEGVLRVALNGRPGRFVDPEAIEPSLRRLGLRADVPVVVYTGAGAFKGWGDGLEQTMVAYGLARFGHDNVYVLDGGLDQWKAEDRPLTKEFPNVEPSDFRVRFRGDLNIEMDELKDSMNDPGTVLIDARGPDVYSGQGVWIKPGHIPGAINIPWPSFMAPDNTRLLRSDQAIQEILNANHLSMDQVVIWYCGTAREATNPFILFKWYLGFPHVRIYEGSFTEWSSYPENPVVTGNEPGRAPRVLGPEMVGGEETHYGV